MAKGDEREEKQGNNSKQQEVEKLDKAKYHFGIN